jgi:hypothetical protein
MPLFVETLVVGTYCALLSRFVNHPFAFGIVKHGLGYLAGLHSWFCRVRDAGKTATVPWGKLASECIFEGIGVFGLCSFLGRSVLAYFIVGCVLHLGSEVIGYHREFVQRCHL